MGLWLSRADSAVDLCERMPSLSPTVRSDSLRTQARTAFAGRFRFHEYNERRRHLPQSGSCGAWRNTLSTAAVRRTYTTSRSHDHCVLQICCKIAALSIAIEITFYFHWVPSARNPAHIPSRVFENHSCENARGASAPLEKSAMLRGFALAGSKQTRRQQEGQSVCEHTTVAENSCRNYTKHSRNCPHDSSTGKSRIVLHTVSSASHSRTSTTSSLRDAQVGRRSGPASRSRCMARL